MKKGVLFTTIGSIIILLISFIAFILPNEFSYAGNNSDSKIVLGKYNNREISYENSQNAYSSPFFENYMEIANFYQMTGNQAGAGNIEKDAFIKTLTQFGYEDYAKKSGYSVPTSSVNREIRKYFLDENKKFSEKSVQNVSSEDILKEKQSITRKLNYSRYYKDLFGSIDSYTSQIFGSKEGADIFGKTELFGEKYSDQEIDFIDSLSSEKRAFNLVFFDNASFPQEEVLAFANKNVIKFTTYDLKPITFANEKYAQKIYEKIKANELTFEDAANDKNATGGLIINDEFSAPTHYSLENLLENKDDIKIVTDLAKDDISKPIAYVKGFVIFKKVGENKAPDFSDEQTIGKVRSYIEGYEISVIEDYFNQRAINFKALAAKEGFDSACASFGVQKYDVPALPLNYGLVSIIDGVDTTIPVMEVAMKNENFLKTAFSLKMDEISDPLVFNKNNTKGICIIQYVENTEPDGEFYSKVGNIVYLDKSSCDTAILCSTGVYESLTNMNR